MFVLTNTNSVANTFIAELRDVGIQSDSLRFRRNIERLGEVMAYELSKTLQYKQVSVQTPLGVKDTELLEHQPVVCTVLRAGLPFYNGFLNYFDQAHSSFIGAWREEGGDEIEVKLNYLASPSLDGRDLIVVDPMLATGKSLVKAIKAIEGHGKPKNIHVVAIIASQPGVDYVREALPEANLFVCDIDETLDENSYIVPGLGDAGDLAFGQKL